MKKTLILVLMLFVYTSFSKAQTYSDFTLPDINGNDVTFSSILEKGPVLMSFWATWCSPCKEEMKKINDLYLKYKDKGFQYVAINQDNQKSISKVKAFITAQNYEFVVLLDTDKKVFEAYSGKDEIPYTLLINKNKEVVASHTGFKTGDEVTLEEEILNMLK
jgi:cytochrome c biogenesis protein CcmG, thiol:disulfide interchange protein DsbE